MCGYVAKHKENAAVILGPPESALPCNVLVFTIAGSVHLQGLWVSSVKEQCRGPARTLTDWLTLAASKLKCLHDPAHKPSQVITITTKLLNSTVFFFFLLFTLCVCSIAANSNRPWLRISAVCLTQCTFCNVVCALWNVSADIFSAVEESTHSSANTTHRRHGVLFGEPTAFQQVFAPHPFFLFFFLICYWRSADKLEGI